MDPAKIEQMADRDGLRNLMENAKRLERDDIYWLAFKRLCSLEGMAYDDPLERDFYDVLNAYEELLTEKHGRTTKASRTRQKLKNKGVEQGLSFSRTRSSRWPRGDSSKWDTSHDARPRFEANFGDSR